MSHCNEAHLADEVGAQYEKIVLSQVDLDRFLEGLDGPPKISLRLRDAMHQYCARQNDTES